MAKEKLSEQRIVGILPEETVLKEGLMRIMRLYGNTAMTVFKYAITDKGIWTLNQKTLFVKQRAVFLPYADLDSYKTTTYGKNDCCIFYPKTGKAGNRVFFDDFAGATEILDQYLERTTGGE